VEVARRPSAGASQGTGGALPPDRRRIVMNQGGYVTLLGFVATEPRLHVVKNGPVAHMRIGSTVRKLDRETGEWRDGDTSFYSVTAWRSLASNAAICLHKGQPVIVAGKVRTKRYEDRSGQPREELEVDADTIGLDLKRGVAHFMRTPRPAMEPAAMAQGEAIRAGLGEDEIPDGPDAPGADADAGMFDDKAIAELEHELDAPATEAAKG
jgi:single-strand DNA-binding protein